MERPPRKNVTAAIIILAALYAVGIAGLSWESTTDWFRRLVPYQLMVSAALLFYFHPVWDKRSVIFFAIVFIGSFGIEVAGVHTGKIFGSYTYGDGLGLKLFSTPVLIGLNWLMLVYCTGHVVHRAGITKPWKEITGAGIMTFIDYLIEPVAVKYGWWSWFGTAIPALNFIAWFYISLVFLFIFFRMNVERRNPVAIPLIAFQTIFFAVLNMIWFMMA